MQLRRLAVLASMMFAALGAACGDDGGAETSSGGAGGSSDVSAGSTAAVQPSSSGAGNGAGNGGGDAGPGGGDAESTSTGSGGEAAASGSGGQGTGTGTGGDGHGGDGDGDGGDASSGDLASLPPDSGGTHEPHALGTTDAAYGYWLYTPGGYETTDQGYPLLVFLHGRGERGDGDAALGRVLNQGVPKLIDQENWDPTYPMLVASPQYEAPDGEGNDNNWGEGDASRLHGFIEHVIATSRVDTTRIYLTGLSHGGNGVYDYLALQDEATSLIAAAAPVAAWGPSNHHDNALHTPIWVFVGSNDGSNFTTSRNFVEAYNAQDPAPEHAARFSVFPGAGHDVWTRTYDLSGMGTADAAYDAYDVGIWDWMFQQQRVD